MEELSVDQFKARMEAPDTIVLDSRNYLSYGSQHIKGSWHLDLNGNFPTFAGWVLPTDKDILLIADDYDKVIDSYTWAQRVGMDRILGYLDGGITAWILSGMTSTSIHQVSAQELHELATGEEDFVLVDVRAPLEYADSHIKGSVNIPVADLRTRYTELDKDKKTVLVCSSGNRSSLGTSILEIYGFTDLNNLTGGMTGYSKAGFTKECQMCANPHGSQFIVETDLLKKHWGSED